MTTIKTLTITSLLALNLVACKGQNGEIEFKTLVNQHAIVDSTSSTTLTIVKVKKPWYAWRSLIIKKMKESIHQYQSIKGINQKFFCFTEDYKLFGGIYFWQTEKDATTWFNQSWYERMEGKYGTKGLVGYYKVESIFSFVDVQSQNGEYWAVLTYSNSNIALDISTQGILKKVILKNSASETCYLTIWENRTYAEKFFKDKNLKNEYFDTPIFLNNFKK
jgi:heme-degrading monooxygenase HmoA